MPTKSPRPFWHTWLKRLSARRRRLKPYLLFESLGSRRVLAAEFNMLADYTTSPFDPGVESLTVVGTQIYFRAATPDLGTVLWKSDGSINGQTIVQDITGRTLFGPDNLTNVNGNLFLSVVRSGAGEELWKTNGTPAGTQSLLFVPSNTLGSIDNLTNVGGTLYFTAQTTDGVELWKSDGTAAGTFMVRDINIGSASSSPKNLTAVGSTLYFSANDGASGVELWKSDGTTLGTVRVADLNPGAFSSNPKYMVNVNGKLAFSVFTFGEQLGISDGTTAGTLTITTSSSVHDLANVNGTLYFGQGSGLWKSNLTPASTQLVRSGFTSRPSKITAVGNTVYFSAGFSNSWPELGKSDGTAAGTVRVLPTTRPELLTNVNGTLYFLNDYNELWSSDGTTSGSVFIKVFPTSAPAATSMVNLGSTVYFATHITLQRHLWQTNGTSAGTFIISSGLNATNSSDFTSPIERNGDLFFDYYGLGSGSSLVRLDTRGVINKVFDLPDFTRQIVNVAGTIYFATDAAIYKTDGTTAGTVLLKTIRTFGNFVSVGNTLFFSALDSNSGIELWKTDGTPAGTTLVRDIEPGSTGSHPSGFVSFNGLVYFQARTTANGSELWKSDGTASGTSLVRDIRTGSTGAYPDQLVAVNNMLYFSADDGTKGSELWRTDGTAAGTSLVRDIQFGPVGSTIRYATYLNGLLYFSADSGAAGRELWVHDPLNNTTSQLLDIRLGIDSSYPRYMTAVGGTVYFTATNSFGRELWKTNGTASSTVLVKDIYAGVDDSRPRSLLNFNGTLYFSADSDVSGPFLWRSDGTNLGTTLVTNPDGSSGPKVYYAITAVNRLVFEGTTRAFGTELFVYGESDYGDAPTQTTYAQNGARHLAVGPMLGSSRDTSEPNGLPGANASGDDTNGIDDEDAFSAAILLNQNGTTSLAFDVNQATSNTRVSAWFDWNFDGDWNDANERVINDLTVTSGTNQFNVTVPAGSSLGNGIARWRISEQSGMTTSGWLSTGEVEDHPFSIVRDINLNLPETSTNDLVIRKSGSLIQIVDRNTSTVIASELQSLLLGIKIQGAATQVDRILLDYDAGGHFMLPSGIEVNGRGGVDTFSIKGTRNTNVTSNASSTVSGQTLLTTSEGSIANAIKYQEFESLTFTQLQSFAAQSSWDIAAKNYLIDATSPVQLAATTTISGGSLAATSIQLPTNALLTGSGLLDGDFFSGVNASIQLNGDLSIGKASSVAGFDFQGTFNIGSHTLTLLDSDQAELNATINLGTSSGGNTLPGKLAAPRGMVLFAISSVNGAGTIETGATSAIGLSNQGSITGQSTANPIVLTGFTSDVGSLSNVEVRGPLDVGSPTAVANYGWVNYAGQLQLDLRGAAPATGHDQIKHSTNAILGGSLLVRLDNNFTPTPGQTLTLLTTSGTFTGTFNSVQLPGVTNGSTWELGYTSNSVVLQLRGMTLDVTPTSISENAGTTTATLTRSDFDLSSALNVTLASTDTTEATVPNSVTIPIGSRTVNFPIQAVDDTLLDGPQTVSILANANGYGGALANLTVTDYETLTLTTSAASISEKGGVATGTITRSNTDLSLARIVNVTVNDISEISVPATVIIPVGQASVSFAITAVDDSLLDGTQRATIGIASSGYVGDSKSIDVEDFETLSLAFSAPAMSENAGVVTATVTRSNTDIASALTIQLQSSDTTEAIVPASVTIPAGRASTTFQVSAVDDSTQDGTQTAIITASASGYVDGTRSIDVVDIVSLSLTIEPGSIAENGGNAIGTISRSSTYASTALVVTLSSNDATEATVPVNVTIAAGEVSATFTITAVDDSILDGTQTVTISANAPSYEPTSRSIAVLDFENLQLTITPGLINEAGGVSSGRVARTNSDIGSSLTVSLTSSDTSQANFPGQVVIPANQSFVDFAISAIDDTLLDGQQNLTLSASAPGYQTASANVVITDSESLSLTLSLNSIRESDGQAIGTVRRNNTDIGLPLQVTITSSDSSEATVPTSVLIPANAASATFTIAAVDDTLLDGTQLVSIEVSAVGYTGASSALSVTDYETLQLTLDRANISENNGRAQLTVSRSTTDNQNALVVQLVSQDASEAQLPTTVTIPAGSASVSLEISAVDDRLLDGSQLVLLQASAASYGAAETTLTVTDHETLTLVLPGTSMSEAAGSMLVRIERSNIDNQQSLTVELASSDTSEATVPNSVTIPAGQAFAEFLIQAVDDLLLDGPQAVTITAQQAAYTSGSATLDVADFENLQIDFDANEMGERNGLIRATLARGNTDVDQPLTVILQVNDPSEASVPASVVIPAGQSSVAFDVLAVDDDLLDGPQTVQVSATSAGYQAGTGALTVTDFEALQLTITAPAISEKNGQTTATIRRGNTNTQQPLIVSLLSLDTTEARVPATVLIPANQSSVTFTIDALDDSLLDGPQSVTIQASAEGYVSAAGNLEISDSESLSLSLVTSSMSEKSGVLSITVTRENTDIAQPLDVNVTVNDPTEVVAPTSVTIPAGDKSITFEIQAVDDDLLDGSQTVTVSMSASGYIGSSRQLVVTDAEQLLLSIDRESIIENGGTAMATITRSNSDITEPLTVTLSTSDQSELSVPATVTLPAGQSSAQFAVDAVDDSLLDGELVVEVVAQATGYEPGQAQLSVTDSETVQLRLLASSMSESGGKITAIVTRSNTDNQLPLTVVLNNSDASELVVPATVVIPAGQSSASFSIDAVDDQLLDGLQQVRLTISAAGYTGDSQLVSVSDVEFLTLAIDTSLISESNGAATGTVTRSNTDTAAPLVVRLSNSAATRVSVPDSITIAAGLSSAQFQILAINNSIIDGSQVVSLGASGDGYASAAGSLTVQDDDRAFPWQNPRNALDVNNSGQVTAIDALLVINGINTKQVLTPQLPDPFDPVAYVDVNGDGFLSAIDALLVINALNSQAAGEANSDATAIAEGESADAGVDWSNWPIAYDWTPVAKRRGSPSGLAPAGARLAATPAPRVPPAALRSDPPAKGS